MAENVESLKKDVFWQMSEFRECVGETKRLHSDNDELREQILDLHIRSMGNNPLFNGVPETDNENTENVLQDVLKKQMKIEKKRKKKVRACSQFGRRDTRRVRAIVANIDCFKNRDTAMSICGQSSKRQNEGLIQLHLWLISFLLKGDVGTGILHDILHQIQREALKWTTQARGRDIRNRHRGDSVIVVRGDA